MTPRIIDLQTKNLLGLSQQMSLVDNRTFELWKNFRARSKEVSKRLSDDFISLQEYPKDYFKEFSPVKKYVKWACVEVENFDSIPEGLNRLVLEGGLYAVFNYQGTSKNAQAFFQYIYGEWIPNSDYNLDDRPHFEVLGAKYKNDDPNSEEEVWIPIKEK
ncbi:GyrI-like domain-containing protein [Maribacter hydrothermalis]|uniref:AraC family transcriptional regulator n=1 Tax=Maribacter hydrothermalis TaxID=1836467 RepID=A0A1B7Z1V6_9FLAO|nr:GyrI-like domain-containing protein [Maribacter hydrothermalis]APQ18328.1 GyrI-like domain-containing protein [Maribacter hydrothermalis]OBR36674.1 AraC family transcriptional regulator [Maribacter hydrothermalis]